MIETNSLELISVVIPAYNEKTVIKRCLNSFVSQINPGPYEILVVDNASTDDTAHIAKPFSKILPLRIISEKTKGRGAARKTGFHEARGAIILSTDADSIVPNNWISVYRKAFDGWQGAITGNFRFPGRELWKNSLVSSLYTAYLHILSPLYNHIPLNGYNFGIRKSYYEQSGGFDATLNAHEDFDLARRLPGKKMVKYIPLAVDFDTRRMDNNFLKTYAVYIRNGILYELRMKKHIDQSDVR